MQISQVVIMAGSEFLYKSQLVVEDGVVMASLIFFSVAYKFITVCYLQKYWVLTKFSGLELIIEEYCNHERNGWCFFSF